MLHSLSHSYAKCVRLVSIFLILPLAMFIAGCGGSSDPGPVAGGPPAVSITPEAAQRFLMKTTFGPRKTDIDRLIALGYEAWVDEQFAMPQTLLLPFHDAAVAERIANRRLLLISQGESDPEVLNDGIGGGQEDVSRMDTWWHASLNGRDQLRQRMAYALSQILVVSDDSDVSGVEARGFSAYYDILLRHAFGNYRDLLKDVTVSPVMATYLSLRGSTRAGRNGSTGQPDENYAREIMQLFSIGLVELNIDGTPKMLNGDTIETYNQTTITNFARSFTGWQAEGGRPYDNWENVPLTPREDEPNSYHDYDSKTLLGGEFVPASLTTEQDLDRALDNIFAHENVAPFISKQLIQRFVTSNPSPGYVERVALVFDDNGSGVRGDLAAVMKAILLDNESINSHTFNNGGKAKEPLLRITQLWRTFNAQSPIRYIRFSRPERYTGQRPLGAESVFNFYSPSFAPSGEIENSGMVAPEFSLLNDSLILSGLDRLAELAESREFGDPNSLYNTDRELPMVLNLTEAKAQADNAEDLLNFYNQRLFGGLMSSGLRSAVITHLGNLPDEADADARRTRIAEEALILLTASPEYSVQR